MVTLSESSENLADEGEFGANKWLVEEMFEKYKENPDSVDKAWWPILERMQHGLPGGDSAAAPVAPATPVADAPAAPAPAATNPVVAKTTRVEAKPAPIPAQAPVTAAIDIVEELSSGAYRDGPTAFGDVRRG